MRPKKIRSTVTHAQKPIWRSTKSNGTPLYAQGNALARRFHMCSDNVKVFSFSILLFFIVLFATVVEVQG